MGGQNEKVLPQTGQTKLSKGVDIFLNDVRIHENAGEVHFHDDKNKLKVAVPASEFWEKWNKLTINLSFDPTEDSNKITFVDTKNQTVAIITPSLSLVKDQWSLDAKIIISKLAVGNAFKQIHAFASRT